MGLQGCVLYLAVMGLLSFPLGRIVPKRWFRYDSFPYRTYRFEREGALYRSLRVQEWKDKVPDMSRLLPAVMPSKQLSKTTRSVSHMERMVQETCVAELVHLLLAVAGFACVRIWRGMGGWVVSLLFALGNLPFIIIQRYNRPRLVRLLHRMKAADKPISMAI